MRHWNAFLLRILPPHSSYRREAVQWTLLQHQQPFRVQNVGFDVALCDEKGVSVTQVTPVVGWGE
jgi:hypothetical protein